MTRTVRPRGSALLPFVVVACLLLGFPGSASKASSSRVVAIGDVHGAAAAFTDILRQAGVIDAAGRWSGGAATLVQTGDVMDRGDRVRDALDLLMSLETEAAAARGRVVALLGNHEIMNLIGVERDVTPAIYATFADEASEATREGAWKAHVALAAARAAQLTPIPALYQPPARDAWLAAHPLGFIEYRQALSPGGRYGRWLRGRDIVASVGDSLFLHGGIGPAHATARVQELNRRARQEIAAFDDACRLLVERGYALPFSTLDETLQAARAALDSTREEVGSRGKKSALGTRDRRTLEVLLTIGSWSIVNPDGPVWFRGLATGNPEQLAAHVRALLDRHHVRRVVIGHSVPSTMRITPRFESRVILIDTGMLASHFRGGRASALEIQGDRVSAIYSDGRVPLGPRD